MKNLRSNLVRLRNPKLWSFEETWVLSEKTGNLRNSPVLEKTHRFLYCDCTECMAQFSFLSHISSLYWCQIKSQTSRPLLDRHKRHVWTGRFRNIAICIFSSKCCYAQKGRKTMKNSGLFTFFGVLENLWTI